MIRALVFDFDGTIVPSNAIKRAAFGEVVADTPGAMARVDALVAARPDADRGTIFRALCKVMPDCGEPVELSARYGRICEEFIVPLLRGSEIDVLLTRLRECELTVHVSSATPRDALCRILERAGLAEQFASIHGAPESKTRALHSILAWRGCLANEIAVIGDGKGDAAAARAVGCRFVPVKPDASQLHGQPAFAAFDFLSAHLLLRPAAGG